VNLGNFITLEGGEGSGKTTQVNLLHQKLISLYDIDVVSTREPGGTIKAEEIRKILLSSSSSEKWLPLTETLLHYASRLEHIENLINPSLNQGKWVICDRFIDSSMAYQGYGMNVDKSIIDQLSNLFVGNSKPDLTIILDIPEQEGLLREVREPLADRYSLMDKEFHRNVRKGFREIAKINGDRCKIINGLDSIENIHNSILEIVVSKFNL